VRPLPLPFAALSVRPKTLMVAKVTRSCSPAALSWVQSLPMLATPAAVSLLSLASAVSVWLSPPNGMWMLITGLTFMRKRISAAATCESELLS